ncbi:sugar phosphate isomerase/epimerase [Kitasatospora sp. NBC_01287]|uniref:sugar phosphate isomerase/epimerase family protein n=1 Tax=Kitasatospora sp. NBC_01287 TaxID=2903573 RepID=UPI00225A42CA|nr:sugar phosphate isomerase/epimerase family protein [Kitasatospora sp. NBC_01287]MCX4747950.1 sugar phosphate isomerase/epimerase [Kitasatospora sp. NBC_01287]
MSTELSRPSTELSRPATTELSRLPSTGHSPPGVERGTRRRIDYCGIADEAAVDLAGQLAATRELGWQSIELRTIDGQPLELLNGPAFARAAARIAEAGLAVPVVASRIGGWSRPISCDLDQELADLTVLADRCAVLGTRYLRIMSYPNDGLTEVAWEREVLRRTRVLAKHAADRGLVLLHENCSGWAGADAGRALRLLEAAGPEAFGFLFDTGNGAAYGYRSLDQLRTLAPYVKHVQVKDATGGPAGVTYTLPGAGEAAVADCLRLLLDTGYQGHWSIEPHLAVRPHEHYRAEPARCRAAFAACGEALRTLAEQLAAADGTVWHPTAAGLAAC